MKKAALLLAVLIITGLVVTPYLVGKQAEQIFAREVEQLREQQTNTSIKKIEHRYQRGLFSSQSQLQLEIHTQQETTSTLTVVIESDIAHGPLLVTDDGLKFGLFASQDQMHLKDLPEELNKLIASTLGDNVITATTLVDFDQSILLTANLQAFTYSKEGTTLNFEGAILHAVGDLKTHDFIGTLELNPIHVTEGESRLDVSAAKGDFTLNAINPPLVVGTFNLLFDRLHINDPQISITFEQLGLTTSQQLLNNKLHISESISIGNIISPIALTGVSYQMDLQGLNPDAVMLWSHMATEINHNFSANSEENYQAQLRELATVIFQPGLKLDQGLRMSAFGGELKIDLDLRYTGLPADIHPLDVQNPVLIMESLDADLFIIADEQALMNSNAALIAQLYLEQGLLVREGDKVVLRGELRSGEFMVNGKPFPLRQILEQQKLHNSTQSAPQVLPQETLQALQ